MHVERKKNGRKLCRDRTYENKQQVDYFGVAKQRATEQLQLKMAATAYTSSVHTATCRRRQ